MKDDAKTYELLRERDQQKRSRQVWAGATIIWAVILGWVLWGFANAITDSAQPLLGWVLLWLVPVVVLAAITWTRHHRLRLIEARIDEVAEDADRKRKHDA